MDSLPLSSAIISYFKNGIPISDLHISSPQKKQLDILIKAWDFYQQNPWSTPAQMRAFFKSLGRSATQISSSQNGDLAYFQYIKENFSPYTKQDLTQVATFGAMQAMKQASMAGDRQDQLKAAALLDRIASRIPDASDDPMKNMTPTDIVFTPFIEDISPEYQTIEDTKLLEILRKEGGITDAMEDKIRDKVSILRGEQEQ